MDACTATAQFAFSTTASKKASPHSSIAWGLAKWIRLHLRPKVRLLQLLFATAANGALPGEASAVASAGQGIPPALQQALRRYATDEHTGTLRAKKASACLFWISQTAMAEIEKALTQHGGGFDGAAGPVRSVSSRSCDLLPAVARVATIIHPQIELADRVARLLVRLELGVSGGAVAVARRAGTRLARADYQDLVKAGLTTADAIDAADDDAILGCVGGDKEKARIVREAASGIRNEPDVEVAPVLPSYEA